MSPTVADGEKVYVDLSVFLAGGGSAGVVSGMLDLAHVPRVGDSLNLLHPPNQQLRAPASVLKERLEVEHVIHSPVGAYRPVTLILSALTVADAAEATEVAQFFEKAWQLEFESHCSVGLGA